VSQNLSCTEHHHGFVWVLPLLAAAACTLLDGQLLTSHHTDSSLVARIPPIRGFQPSRPSAAADDNGAESLAQSDHCSILPRLRKSCSMPAYWSPPLPRGCAGLPHWCALHGLTTVSLCLWRFSPPSSPATHRQAVPLSFSQSSSYLGALCASSFTSPDRASRAPVAQPLTHLPTTFSIAQPVGKGQATGWRRRTNVKQARPRGLLGSAISPPALPSLEPSGRVEPFGCFFVSLPLFPWRDCQKKTDLVDFFNNRLVHLYVARLGKAEAPYFDRLRNSRAMDSGSHRPAQSLVCFAPPLQNPGVVSCALTVEAHHSGLRTSHWSEDPLSCPLFPSPPPGPPEGEQSREEVIGEQGSRLIVPLALNAPFFFPSLRRGESRPNGQPRSRPGSPGMNFRGNYLPQVSARGLVVSIDVFFTDL
jgi:hypothetical protein